MEIRIYKTKEGKQPFIKWYDDLKDQSYQLRIRKRLRRNISITAGSRPEEK
jgi:putative component of toxin-antitoxin plasmid stabilization module